MVRAGDDGTYVGGLMVTDASGLPVDFRYTDPVTPDPPPAGPLRQRPRPLPAVRGGAAHPARRARRAAEPAAVDDPGLLDEPIDGFPVALVAPSKADPIGAAGARSAEGTGTFLLQADATGHPLRVSLPAGSPHEAAVVEALVALSARMDVLEPIGGVQDALDVIVAGEAAAELRRSGGPPLAEIRRLVARLGASPVAREVARPAAAAHAADVPRPRVGAPATHLAPAVRRAAAPATSAVAVPPPPLAPVPNAAAAAVAPPPPAAGRQAPVTAARRCTPVGGVRAHRGVPAAARLARRGRTPWHLLGRDRLGAAWEAVQRDHGGGLADLRLAGVYGPLPLGAVTAASLEPDGRLRVVLGGRRPGRTGDVALARDAATGRLVRADVPYPETGGVGRRLR